MTRDLGRKALRYAAVSMIGVVVTQALLLDLHVVLGWSAATANVAAVSAAAVPAYLLNRRWVWGKEGAHDVAREILPFWGFAVVGLLISTTLVTVATRWFESPLAASGANLVGFGMLWVLKFFVLDRVLFAPRPVASPA